MVSKKKQIKEYVILFSECGDNSQLTVMDEGNVTVYDSIESAKKDAARSAEEIKNDGGDVPDFAIVKIILRGKASEIIWT